MRPRANSPSNDNAMIMMIRYRLSMQVIKGRGYLYKTKAVDNCQPTQMQVLLFNLSAFNYSMLCMMQSATYD